VPDVEQKLGPAERVMRQWYQGKLAERLGQFAAMQQDRAILRRGAIKMQDGTLGQSAQPPTVEDDMNIRVGDEVHNHYPTAAAANQESVQPSAEPSLLRKFAPLLLAGAIGAGAVAAPRYFQGEAPALSDTDTQYFLELVGDTDNVDQ